MPGRHSPHTGVPVRACARKMNHAMILCVHMLTCLACIPCYLSALIENVEKPSHTNGLQR